MIKTKAQGPPKTRYAGVSVCCVCVFEREIKIH